MDDGNTLCLNRPDGFAIIRSIEAARAMEMGRQTINTMSLLLNADLVRLPVCSLMLEEICKIGYFLYQHNITAPDNRHEVNSLALML